MLCMRTPSLEADGEADVSGRHRKGDWEAAGSGGGRGAGRLKAAGGRASPPALLYL